jgi:eukaryotic-like serine/threonine-protein kinase
MASEPTQATTPGDDLTSDRTGAAPTLTASPEADDAQAAPPVLDGPDGRYELLEKIAQGGMGAVLRARDRTLDREVAVKVLQDRFKAGSLMARRFVDEARIAGQLQHPGIPPVHDLGTLPDGRPFLAMKLIKGRTLDALLRDRAGPDDDRGRFLAAFEQVCQGVAYAHAHRVIHRDLKPLNVMVGAFGEVQVMDWGLAKVLTDQPASAPEPPSGSDEQLVTEIRAGRDEESSETQAGSVLGTPAYMAPEQAVGAIDQIDARSDVFGLGAILAVVLTGRPPFVADSAEEARVLAARGKLDDCLARLESCGADPDLIALCRRCLSPERDDRPADAGAVAAAVAGLRAEAEERARRAELDRVRAEAEARAQRQKRRAQLAAAAGALGLLVVGGIGWTAVRNQALARRADAGRVASIALGRAQQLAGQADGIDPGEVAAADEALELLDQAASAIEQAEAALAGAGDAALAAQVRGKAAEVRAGLVGARRAAALLGALEAARGADVGSIGGSPDHRSTVRMYRAAFAAAGLSADGEPRALAEAVAAERPGLREALVRALDDWVHRLQFPPDPDAERVRAAADFADPDPARKEIRAAVGAGDQAALARLVGRLKPTDLDPATAVALEVALRRKGLAPDALRILRAVRDRHPSDFFLLMALSVAIHQVSPGNPVAIEESFGCARAALAAYPAKAWPHYLLGHLYYHDKRDPDSAEPHLLRALELNSRFTFAMTHLGDVRRQKGDLAGAERWFRKPIELDPNDPFAHSSLGRFLLLKGDLASAAAEYRKVVELDPKSSWAHSNLGWALHLRGDLAGAEAEYRKGIELDPNDPIPRKNLALVRRIGPLLPRLDDVVAGRGAPDSPAEAVNLALLCAQRFRGQYAAAARLFDRAFADDPRQAEDLTLSEDLVASHRYYAACAAALASVGRGSDAPAAAVERAALRREALGWLRADLAAWAGKAAAARAERVKAAAVLDVWLGDGEEFGVGPGKAPDRLPADEQSAWDALWADVRAALERARKPAPAAPPAP